MPPLIYRQAVRRKGETVSLVPTMGALHEGHLSLLRRGKAVADRCVTSIFVNPTQFLPHEDLSRYPRPLEADLEKLRSVGGDVAFLPSVAEMYGEGSRKHATFVDIAGVGELSEGRIRPGHFRGVATVVTKLLNIVQPEKALFGQKDGLQSIVIRRLVRELNIDTQIIICPTQREPDGLAMSSRNVYLSEEDRKVAPTVYKALQAAEAAWQGGERSAAGLKAAISSVVRKEPKLSLQYVSVAETLTGEEVEGRAEGPVLVSIAVGLTGKSLRLIDNIALGGGFLDE